MLAPLTEHHAVILLMLKLLLKHLLEGSAVGSSLLHASSLWSSLGGSVGGREGGREMYLAVTRIFCLILAADSRGDHGRASALHKSKLLELVFFLLCHHMSQQCVRYPPGSWEHTKNRTRKSEFSH